MQKLKLSEDWIDQHANRLKDFPNGQNSLTESNNYGSCARPLSLSPMPRPTGINMLQDINDHRQNRKFAANLNLKNINKSRS